MAFEKIKSFFKKLSEINNYNFINKPISLLLYISISLFIFNILKHLNIFIMFKSLNTYVDISMPIFLFLSLFLTGSILLKIDKFTKRNQSQPELKEENNNE